MPRTSPTRQSRPGLSGWRVVAMVTQARSSITGAIKAHPVAENRARGFDNLLAGIIAEGLNRFPFESRRAVVQAGP